MKRICAILKEKLEDVKLENKVKRVTNALNTAKTNAESDLMEVDDQMSSVLETLKDKDVTPNEVINKLAELINRKKEIEEGIANIELVDKYINEEIDV
jgi:hypothetical protein